MKKKLWIFPTIVLLILTILAGCSQNENNDSAKGNELEELTIMLDWYPNAVHTGIYYAKEKGFFEDEGLNVTIEMPAETNDPLKLAATGKVDLAISYQMQVALARSEDIPVISLAAIVRHSLDGIMFKKESGIVSPKDLEGKSVGYASSSISEAVVETMIKTDGGDPSKVRMVDVGWDLMPAIATDNVDALTSAYSNHEFVILKKEGHDMVMIPPSDYGVPENYELVLVTGEDTLKKKKTSFEKFWRAMAKGQEAVTENPEAALQLLLTHEEDNFPLDKEIEMQSLEVLLPLMDTEKLPFGYQEEESWNGVIEWLFGVGIIKEKFDPTEAYENVMSE